MEAIMDGAEKARFDPQQQALFRQWITSPAAGYVRQNPDGTPYREPQPTLTDAEAWALQFMLRHAAWACDQEAFHDSGDYKKHHDEVFRLMGRK
jgi:hypothetical protein